MVAPGQSEKQVLQNLINGDSADKSVRKQRIWKKDFLRQDDFSKMKDMVQRLRKYRNSEAAQAGGGGASAAANTSSVASSKAKAVGARTSIQQTQGSNILIKKENPNRRSYLNK